MSIRRRLALVLSIGFAALVVGTALYVERILRGRVTEDFDAALVAEARALETLVAENEEGEGEFEYVPACMPHFERKERPDYFQIWLADGTPTEDGRSGSLAAGAELPRWTPAAREPESRDVRLPDGRAGRAVQHAFAPVADGSARPAEGAPALVIMVARGRERLDAFLSRVRLAVLGGGGIAALLAALLVRRALASGLRPIDAIASQVRALDADNLAARIPVPPPPSELAPIAQQLNALLERLEASFDRERRFAGHVAHELRTPIAELRSLAEVGGRWPEDLASTRRFFADVHEIAGRMERVVVDLLLLARCHAGVEKAQRRAVRLLPLVQALPGADRAEIDVPDLVVDSDPGKLSLIVRNLLDNALSYAAPGPIRVVAATGDGRFTLDVTNHAEPLSEEDLRRLAEPFWRKDRARSPEGHSGLGLSLVTALAGLLGHEVGFAQDGAGVFRARVSGRLWSQGEPPKPIQRFVPHPEPEYKEEP